jgi:hypothetical protein
MMMECFGDIFLIIWRQYKRKCETHDYAVLQVEVGFITAGSVKYTPSLDECFVLLQNFFDRLLEFFLVFQDCFLMSELDSFIPLRLLIK